MQTINRDGKIICIIYRDNDWKEGLNFITPDSLFVQVGSWWYNKDKKLDAHIHKDFDRTASRTMEMTYIKNGSMKVDLYDENQISFDSFILKKGDLAVFAYGGHGYTILEDDTKIIEAKNGPFVDVETDKNKF
jgi:hypothetical protein